MSHSTDVAKWSAVGATYLNSCRQRIIINLFSILVTLMNLTASYQF